MPAPIYRGQANALFRTDKQDTAYKRGQEVPYNVNGAPTGDGILNLNDPNADRMVMWDDSAGDFAWLAPGSRLVISGTTINTIGALVTYIVDLPTANPGDPLFELEIPTGGSIFTGSDQISAGVAATAPSDLRIFKNGLANGTISFTGTAGVAAFSDSNYAAGDIFALYPPAVVDATLDRVRITLGTA